MQAAAVDSPRSAEDRPWGAVRAVVFDAVGTLLHPQPKVADAYHAAAVRHGLTVPAEEIRRRFQRAFARQEQFDDERQSGRTSQQREHARWREIVADVFPEAPRPDVLFDDLWEHFAQPRHWRLCPQAPALIGQLTSRGFMVAVASNFDDRLPPICQALPPLDRCEVFVSSQLGVRKPHGDFFRAIERRLQLQPQQLLLIGDDLHNDYLGASAAGWQALLLGSSSAAGNGIGQRQRGRVADDQPSVRCVAGLDEVAALLGA